MDASLKKESRRTRRAQPKGRSRTLARIKSVAIIGAGQMGNGIAHVVALAGYNVL